MLFNSHVFLFLFLPCCLVAYHVAARLGAPAKVWLLVGASLWFYAGWDARYLPLLLASIAFNFGIGRGLSQASSTDARRRFLLALGIGANLALLVWYKYAAFLLEVATGSPRDPSAEVLPLGISFYTFTQIAFLVDSYRGRADEPRPGQYAAFVTFFPHLIAGPILHHHEIIPQFRREGGLRSDWLAPGLALFSLGLAKKVLIADPFGAIARPVFQAYSIGTQGLSGGDAWTGALAYTLQLYFDFSAYSDMAVGLGLMFGIWLPLNFDSPYQAESIVDFWRRWHMTLSRYLRDYVYVPLGGNRHGTARRYLNLALTMCIGGLWHGAGWTFLCWGALHGAFLLVNHAWRALRGNAAAGFLERRAGQALTFLAVVVAWVFFRSTSLAAAMQMLRDMLRPGFEFSLGIGTALRDVVVPVALRDAGFVVPPEFAVATLLAAGLLVVWCLPNAHTIVFQGARPWSRPLETEPAPAHWRASAPLAIGAALAFVLSVIALVAAPPGEFLYFTF